MNNNLQTMLVHLSASYPSIIRLIFAISFLMGLSMTVSALYKLKVYGEMRTMMASQTNLKEPLLMLLTAAMFIYLPSALDTMLVSTYGTSLDQLKPLSYITNGSSDFQQGYAALLGLIRIVGLISFIRGWHLIASASQQGRAGQGFGKGLTHIIGGLLALNIVGTKEVLWSTLGFE